MSEPHRAAVTEAILEHLESLMRHAAGAHAPGFLGVEVTMAQAKCLFIVALQPGIGMSALAAQLHVGPSAVSGLVDRLVEHGYLDRHEAPSDRRQQQLTLTRAGEAVLERIREINAEPLRELLRGLDAPELEALLAGVAALDREARLIHERRSSEDGTSHERTLP
jgi:DNA-binding MarR family transcriptional regulator